MNIPDEPTRQVEPTPHTPAPLLVVDYQGRITVRKDLTVYGLMQIIEALKNMPVAGA